MADHSGDCQSMLVDFFNSDQATAHTVDVDADLAKTLQRNLLAFLQGRDFPWSRYGAEKSIVNITEAGFQELSLPEDLRRRCEMINRVISDPENGA